MSVDERMRVLRADRLRQAAVELEEMGYGWMPKYLRAIARDVEIGSVPGQKATIPARTPARNRRASRAARGAEKTGELAR